MLMIRAIIIRRRIIMLIIIMIKITTIARALSQRESWPPSSPGGRAEGSAGDAGKRRASM